MEKVKDHSENHFQDTWTLKTNLREETKRKEDKLYSQHEQNTSKNLWGI